MRLVRCRGGWADGFDHVGPRHGRGLRPDLPRRSSSQAVLDPIGRPARRAGRWWSRARVRGRHRAGGAAAERRAGSRCTASSCRRTWPSSCGPSPAPMRSPVTIGDMTTTRVPGRVHARLPRGEHDHERHHPGRAGRRVRQRRRPPRAGRLLRGGGDRPPAAPGASGRDGPGVHPGARPRRHRDLRRPRRPDRVVASLDGGGRSPRPPLRALPLRVAVRARPDGHASPACASATAGRAGTAPRSPPTARARSRSSRRRPEPRSPAGRLPDAGRTSWNREFTASGRTGSGGSWRSSWPRGRRIVRLIVLVVLM